MGKEKIVDRVHISIYSSVLSLFIKHLKSLPRIRRLFYLTLGRNVFHLPMDDWYIGHCSDLLHEHNSNQNRSTRFFLRFVIPDFTLIDLLSFATSVEAQIEVQHHLVFSLS
jgi:hypothetical protein